jgi:uncharacterized protein (TIGR00369 family)
MTDIPPGFQLLPEFDEVMAGFAPIHGRRTEDGGMLLGFHVSSRHCNPRGNCHGGTWATMADVVMGMNVGFLTGLSGPTISLNIDFLGAARAGQWAEGRAEVVRSTPNLGFAECRFTADGTLVLRATAVFRRKFTPPFRDFGALVVAD